jgi:hypothetical protein
MHSVADLPGLRKLRGWRFPAVAAGAAGAVLIGGAGIFLAIVQQEPTGERPLSAEREKALTLKTSFRECAAGCPEMIAIPSGAFTMGAVPRA